MDDFSSVFFNRNLYKPSILLVYRTVARTWTQDRDGRNLDGGPVVYLRRRKGRIQVTQATTTRNAGVAQEEVGATITAVVTILDDNIIINYYYTKNTLYCTLVVRNIRVFYSSGFILQAWSTWSFAELSNWSVDRYKMF